MKNIITLKLAFHSFQDTEKYPKYVKKKYCGQQSLLSKEVYRIVQSLVLS